MSTSYDVYCGPYLRCSIENVDAAEALRGCVNKGCPRYHTEAYGKHCMECGSAIQEYAHPVNRPKVDSWALDRGTVGEPFIAEVRESRLPGMTFEGVVCKGTPEKKDWPLVMFKLKSQAWYDCLKGTCGDDTELFKKLA